MGIVNVVKGEPTIIERNTQDFPPSTPFMGKAATDLIINQKAIGFMATGWGQEANFMPSPTNIPTGGVISHGMIWTSDSRFLIVAHSNSPYLSIYDWISGRPIKIETSPELINVVIACIALSPDDQYLLIGHSGTNIISIYEWNLGNLIYATQINSVSPPLSLAISPDGRYLALTQSSAGSSIDIWDWTVFPPVKTAIVVPLPNAGARNHITWSPNSLYMSVASTGAESRGFTLYDWSSNAPIKIPPTNTVPLDGMLTSFSPCGNYIAVGLKTASTSGGVEIVKINHDSKTLTHIASAFINIGISSGISWSPDGVYLTAIGTAAPYYSFATFIGELVTVVVGKLSNLPASAGKAVAFSPNGRYLAIGSGVTPFIFSYQTFTEDIIIPYNNLFEAAALRANRKSFHGIGFAREDTTEGEITVMDVILRE